MMRKRQVFPMRSQSKITMKTLHHALSRRCGAWLSVIVLGVLAIPTGATAAKVRSDFSVVTAVDEQVVEAGSSVVFDFSIRRAGGFRGAVAWSVKGLPEGATSTVVKKPGDARQLSVTTPRNLSTTKAVLVLSGRSGAKVRTLLLRLTVVGRAVVGSTAPLSTPLTTTITTTATTAASVTTTAATVLPPPTSATTTAPTVAPTSVTVGPTVTSTTLTVPKFDLRLSTTEQEIYVGETAKFKVFLTRLIGYPFGVPAVFSVTGAPQGSATLFDPAEILPGAGDTTLSVIVGASSAPTTSTLTITATAGTMVRTTTIRLVTYRKVVNGVITLDGIENDVVPGETLRISVTAAGQPIEGGRIRVSVDHLSSGNAIRVLEGFLAVGETRVFDYKAGPNIGKETLIFHAPNPSTHDINVQPFALRAPRTRFQVEQGKTVTVPLSIFVAKGVDRLTVGRLVANPKNQNVSVPGYDLYLVQGNWNVEVTAGNNAAQGNTSQEFILFTYVGPTLVSSKTRVNLDIYNANGTAVVVKS